MGTEFAWVLWVVGAIALLSTAGPIHDSYPEAPRAVRVTHAIVLLIWIAPVLIRAWLMVVVAA